jgi:hypothetical protein
MRLRAALAALVVAATAAFVTGVALERHSRGDHHEASAARSEPAGGEEPGESGESHAETPAHPSETAEELRPLGIDVEAWPFVALAAIASLALLAAALVRPRAAVLLALAMLAFAALDVREVAHQLDEDDAGLATLAGAVAALHLAAAAVAAAMLRAINPSAPARRAR